MIDTLRTGAGAPVTVFAHGLGESIASTRPFASGVAGTRIFFHFRGHGATPLPPGAWSYADLAAELREVADDAGAEQALGISLGAGVLLRLLVASPQRFDRVVLLLPAMLDQERQVPPPTRPGLPPAAAEAYAGLLRHPPLTDRDVLADCPAAVLVIGQEGDAEHPAEVAREVAAALPRAELEILPPGGLLVAHRARLRQLVSRFLDTVAS